MLTMERASFSPLSVASARLTIDLGTPDEASLHNLCTCLADNAKGLSGEYGDVVRKR